MHNWFRPTQKESSKSFELSYKLFIYRKKKRKSFALKLFILQSRANGWVKGSDFEFYN